MENNLLSIKDIRRRLNCATSTIYRWIEEDHFPRPMRLGGMARWEEADVEAFLERAKAKRLPSEQGRMGIRRPGRPPAYPNKNYIPRPNLDPKGKR